ncbi:MAG: hypothetical protein ABI401_03945 [Candidatus Dormibacter sp.]
MLAYRATEALYAEQPDLWRMGERGRARTLEDFGRHFEALTTLDTGLFREYVTYCMGLFSSHGFPQAWLVDAWRIMGTTIERELPATVSTPALGVLRAGSDVAAKDPRRDGA